MGLHKILVLISNAQKPPENAHADEPSEAIGLAFAISSEAISLAFISIHTS